MVLVSEILVLFGNSEARSAQGLATDGVLSPKKYTSDRVRVLVRTCLSVLSKVEFSLFTVP